MLFWILPLALAPHQKVDVTVQFPSCPCTETRKDKLGRLRAYIAPLFFCFSLQHQECWAVISGRSKHVPELNTKLTAAIRIVNGCLKAKHFPVLRYDVPICATWNRWKTSGQKRQEGPYSYHEENVIVRMSAMIAIKNSNETPPLKCFTRQEKINRQMATNVERLHQHLKNIHCHPCCRSSH